MSNDQQHYRFNPIRDLPAWIQTIVGVLVLVVTTIPVLVLLGVIEISVGSDETTTPAQMESVAAPEEDDRGDATASDPETPKKPAKVFWSGPLEFPPLNGSDAAYSLDVRPPRYVAGRSIRMDFLSDSIYAYEDSAIVVADWPSDSTRVVTSALR